MSASPSTSSDSSPPRATGPVPADQPRPSLARTSISTQSTARTLSTAYGAWEQSDIRGDLAAGWGGGSLGGGAGGNDASPPGVGAAGGTLRGGPIFRRVGGGGGDDNSGNNDDEWGWRLRDDVVHPVPTFLPMDPRCTRRVDLTSGGPGDNGGGVPPLSSPTSVEEISLRISTACQKLSIHGMWNNESPTATLSSMEGVEMEVNVYLGEASTESVPATASLEMQEVPPPPSPPQVLLVELQRRKGCSITFHNYRRCLLDAAEGKFDPEAFNQKDGLDKPSGRDRCNQPRASLGRPSLSRPGSISRPSPMGGPARPSLSRPGSISRPSPMGAAARPAGMTTTLSPPSSPAGINPNHPLRNPSFSADDASMSIAGLKTAGGESFSGSSTNNPNATVEKAMQALTMAASLLKKDRVDARRVGIESLVLLTDPLRAGMDTAKIASRVVLLGTARDEPVWQAAHDAGITDDDVEALFDESAGLGIREAILEMIMTDDDEEEKMAFSDSDGFMNIEKEFTDSLFNLCLTVLSNALHTIEESVTAEPHKVLPFGDGVEDDRKPSPRNSPGTPRHRRSLTDPTLSKRFIDDTNSAFGCDVLSSLIKILGQARTNPHDAYHSAKCLGVLFKGCGNSHKARARRDLDAKRIVAAALEVGSRTHAKLADASRVAMLALVTDDEDSVEEEEPRAGGTTEVEDAQIQESEGAQQQEQQDEELPSVINSMSAEQEQQRQELPSVIESMSAESEER
ncbi:hypothetical protein ACHAWF_005721 [Thalassiosira exigua]